MNKAGAVFLREYLERVRRRSFVIGLVLVPLFMAALTLLPAWLATRDVETAQTVLILDETGLYKQALEEAIQTELESGEPRFRFADWAGMAPELTPHDLSDPQVLDGLLKDQLLDWYLYVPADLEETAAVEFHGRIVSNIALLEMLDSRFTGVLRRQRMEQLNLDPGLYEQLSASAELQTFRHIRGDSSQAGFETVFFSTFLFVMVLYMTIIVFGAMIQRSILEDKNQRVTEVVLSSMSSSQFFAGKILGIGAVGLTQYVAWGLMAAAVFAFGAFASFDMSMVSVLQPSVYLFFMLFYVLGFFLYAGLFAMVGAMVTTDQEAQQMMQPIIFIIIIPIIAMTFIMQNPDSALSVTLSMIPFTSPLVMFMRINLSMPPTWQLLLSIGILLASVWGIFVAAGRIFKVGILMTGKKASLAEAARWIREAR